MKTITTIAAVTLAALMFTAPTASACRPVPGKPNRCPAPPKRPVPKFEQAVIVTSPDQSCVAYVRGSVGQPVSQRTILQAQRAMQYTCELDDSDDPEATYTVEPAPGGFVPLIVDLSTTDSDTGCGDDEEAADDEVE